MLRIGICEDESYYTEQIISRIMEWAEEYPFLPQVERFTTGEELLLDIEENGSYAFVFLDIGLPGINGIAVAERIREQSRYTGIIFISQYDSYFREMLRLGHVYFLEKPIQRENMNEVLGQIVRDYHHWHENFAFRYDRHTYHIPLHSVMYFTSDKRLIRISLVNRRNYVFYEKLDVLEKKLSAYKTCFLRIHKSYLVNANYIEQFMPARIVLCNGEELTISREYRSRVMDFHIKLLN